MKTKTASELFRADAEKRRLKAIKLYRGGKGLSQAEIGRRLGVSRARVNQIVRAA